MKHTIQQRITYLEILLCGFFPEEYIKEEIKAKIKELKKQL